MRKRTKSGEEPANRESGLEDKGKLLSRRSLLSGAIAALAIGTGNACSLVVDDEQPDVAEHESEKLREIKAMYSRVFELAGLLNDPELMTILDDTLTKYLEGEQLDNTHYGHYSPAGYSGSTKLEKKEAYIMHARKIAFLIMSDYYGKYTWKLGDLNDAGIRDILTFDPNYYCPYGKDYVLSDTVPSYPEEIAAFLEENDLIKENHESTVYALVNWFRNNAIHINASEGTAEALEKTYGHTGAPSVAEMLKQPKIGKFIRIQGCYGSVEFFEQILETIGIPVQTALVILDSEKNAGGYSSFHHTARFPSIGKAVYHGDDLHKYYDLTMDEREIPPSDILVDITNVPVCPIEIFAPLNEERHSRLMQYEEMLNIEKKYHMHRLELAEKYITYKLLYSYCRFLNGTADYPPFGEPDIKKLLPEERLSALYVKMRNILDQIGDYDLINAEIFLLERINKRSGNLI